MKRESSLPLRPLVAIGLGIACLLHAACFPKETARPGPKFAVAPATQPIM